MRFKDFITKYGLVLTSTRRPATLEDVNSYRHNPDATHWNCALRREGSNQKFLTDYHLGSGRSYPEPHLAKLLRESRWYHRARPNPKAPTLEELLESLQFDVLNVDQEFAEWASDMGLSTDSRSAEKTYLACVQARFRLRALFGDYGFKDFLECRNDDDAAEDPTDPSTPFTPHEEP